MRAASVIVGLMGLLFVCSIASGQTPASLEFDVAAVKRAAPLTAGMLIPPRGGPGSTDPGRVNFRSLSLKNLLETAYVVKNYQITGPAWMDSERYDIVATVPPGATKEQVNVMLQNLLTERFQLMLHRETQDLPLYELVVAKNGPKLKPYDPSAPKQPEPGGPLPMGKDGPTLLPPGNAMKLAAPGRTRLLGSKKPIATLADMLAIELGRPVVDKTGLTSEYDYSLEFLPERPNGPPGAGPVPTSDSDPPTLLAAVQEQLGLRLEQKKGPLEILVIDHAEKVPTAN